MNDFNKENVNIECNTLNEIFKVVKSIKSKDTTNNEYFFRGQRNADWNLISSLKRDVMDEYKNADRVKRTEIIINEIEKEIENVKKFKEKYRNDIELIKKCQKEIVIKNLKPKIVDIQADVEIENDVSIIALMQHYGEKTRALDFSENLLVALYFAVAKETEGNAALWVLNKRMMVNIMWVQNKSDYVELPHQSDIRVNLKRNYLNYLYEDLEFYKKQLNRMNSQVYGDNYCGPEIFKNDILELKEDCFEQMSVGFEKFGVFANNLYSNIFNKRLQCQAGVFILQSYKPEDIKEEYDKMIQVIKEGHFQVKGKMFDKSKIYSPFTKVIINKKCHQEIRDFLQLVGITEKSLGL